MIPRPTAKRTACDRCRAQRLRCSRTEDSIAPCERCIRTGVSCKTDPAKRLGRPRKLRAVVSGGPLLSQNSICNNEQEQELQTDTQHQSVDVSRSALSPMEITGFSCVNEDNADLVNNFELANPTSGATGIATMDFSLPPGGDEFGSFQLFPDEIGEPEWPCSLQELSATSQQSRVLDNAVDHAPMNQSIRHQLGGTQSDILQRVSHNNIAG